MSTARKITLIVLGIVAGYFTLATLPAIGSWSYWNDQAQLYNVAGMDEAAMVSVLVVGGIAVALWAAVIVIWKSGASQPVRAASGSTAELHAVAYRPATQVPRCSPPGHW